MTAREARSPIHSFLRNEIPDHSGRVLDDILKFSDRELEIIHDYIQWIFPLLVLSSAVPSSPVLTKIEIQDIRNDEVAVCNIRRAKERMLDFYERNDHWLVPHDHNHLRITRIIRSLHLLVGADYAEEFLEAIMERVVEAGRPVSRKNVDYWMDAANLKSQSL